jgi:hypothetical protein
MLRNWISATVIVLALAGSAHAQSWAQKMFKVTSHEFGTVAKGAKTEFAFTLQNLYEEDVHIASVRSSCGCTSASVSGKDTLKTWETSTILAVFNTRTFSGQRGATVTVTIDKPYYAEVQLRVGGYIRSDVDFSPGLVGFGEIDQGQPTEAKVVVTNYSRQDWRITDVRSANENLEVELSDPVRAGGGVSYTMLVRLKGSAPVGYLQDQLTLVTNESANPRVPISVEGRVKSPLDINPSTLFLGSIEPGQAVTKQLVVRAKKPFKITNIKCENDCFQFNLKDEAKTIHLIPLVFTAGENEGELEQAIEIQTDLGANVKGKCVARASVVASTAKVKVAKPTVTLVGNTEDEPKKK